jgi:DNA-binding SARP family transcriptional activator
MSDLKLYVLGPPRLEVDCAPVEIKRRKALALLIYLALTGETQRRDTLATLLWPDSSQRNARAALRRDLAILNRAVGGNWLTITRETIGLRHNPNFWLDVEQFQQRLAICQTHDHPSNGVCPACLKPLNEAVKLYRDDFLAGFTLSGCPAFDEWQFFQTEGLRQVFAATLAQLVRGLTTQADYQAALPHARRWLAFDPLHEPAHRQLMKLYAQIGQQAAAVRQYQECVRILAKELGVSPQEETSALYERLRSGDLDQHRATSANRFIWSELESDERRVALKKRLEPPSYTQLVGVEEHLDQLRAVLTSPGPPWLISIEGLGGLGKTSLADALSRQIIDARNFADFGWVSARQVVFNPGGAITPVDMPALTAEDLVEKLVAQLMADVPRPTPFSAQDALAALRARLTQSAHLIVIDNLETVVDLESLLPTLRDLVDPTKFLLTSRESWHHEPGLYHFNLPELSEASALRLIRYEAQLCNLPYLAQASDADLRRIYELVGGNPLALRLVVGQTHVHALEVILADLRAAGAKKVQRLYSYIYRRAWDNFDQKTRQVFLAMPLVTDLIGDEASLANLTGLDSAEVGEALERLVALNLVDSRGDLDERRYAIHNLTRTFLQEQVAQWQ